MMDDQHWDMWWRYREEKARKKGKRKDGGCGCDRSAGSGDG